MEILGESAAGPAAAPASTMATELKAVAGDPAAPGKKLIFLVTHSPIFLELRTVEELASLIVFAHNRAPLRATPDKFTEEERLKVRQALPSFHAGQRELLFSNAPIVVEGPSDSAVLMNVATRLALPLGASGIGIAPMGGKYQLLAFRALTTALAKRDTRFILDLDAVIDTKALHCLDSDERVVEMLRSRGRGDKTLTQLIGELKGLLRDYLASKEAAASGPTKNVGTLGDSDLAVGLRVLKDQLESEAASIWDKPSAQTVLGKVDVIRAAA